MSPPAVSMMWVVQNIGHASEPRQQTNQKSFQAFLQLVHL